MLKRVILLAVSCKTGGLCPGGIDVDNLGNWIRLVADDGKAGSLQGFEIDMANPLDLIEFDGRPAPLGKQVENWVIDNNSCKCLRKAVLQDVCPGAVQSNDRLLLEHLYQNYSYHGFWGNAREFLDKFEFNNINYPTESIIKAQDIKFYFNGRRWKIDFTWDAFKARCTNIPLTDSDVYSSCSSQNAYFYKNAYLVVSIPNSVSPEFQNRAYKFVSKIYGFND